MAATEKDVESWIKIAKESGATHVISVCDTFDHDDYAVFVMPGDSLDALKAKYNGPNMQRINEIIKIKKE